MGLNEDIKKNIMKRSIRDSKLNNTEINKSQTFDETKNYLEDNSDINNLTSLNNIELGDLSAI